MNLSDLYWSSKAEFTVSVMNGEEPVDLTGWSFWFTMKSRINHPDSEAIIQLTSGAGITIEDAEAGKIKVVIESDDWPATPDMSLNVLYYDLQGKDASGDIYTLLYGTSTVYRRITLAID